MRPFLSFVVLCIGCARDVAISPDPETVDLPRSQPIDPRVNVDRVVQVTIPSVDILFVVDNSCSMEEEQVALSTNFPAMLQYFVDSELDWHIGVVSTDMNDPLQGGRLRAADGLRWLDAETEAPGDAFSQMVSLGVTGSGNEQGIAAAYSAVELLARDDGPNAGFVRPEAALHITVISDEDDSTNRPGGSGLISRSEFVEYLRTARPSGRYTSFSSIVGPTTGCAEIGEPGSDYMAITRQVGGVTWPICTDNWSQALDELGFLATGLNREFFLSRTPEPATITVSVVLEDGTVQQFERDDWDYRELRNSIRFVDHTPEPLSVVTIEYVERASDGAVIDTGI